MIFQVNEVQIMSHECYFSLSIYTTMVKGTISQNIPAMDSIIRLKGNQGNHDSSRNQKNVIQRQSILCFSRNTFKMRFK